MAKVNRIIYNRAILHKLQDCIEKYPDMRFIQLLWDLNIIRKNPKKEIEDNYYEESEVTWSKVRTSNIFKKVP